MKLYKRDLEITPQDELHLEVDHYLTPIEITEEEIEGIILDAVMFNHTQSEIDEVDTKWAAKAILSKLKGE